MEMIKAGTECKLTVTPPGTTLWEEAKKETFKATDNIGANGNQQFLYGGTKAIYANNGNGFLIEPVTAQ